MFYLESHITVIAPLEEKLYTIRLLFSVEGVIFNQTHLIFVKQLYKAIKNTFTSDRFFETILEIKKTFRLTDDFTENFVQCKSNCITALS